MLPRRDWPAESQRRRWAAGGARVTRWKSPEIESNEVDLRRETNKTNVDGARIREAVMSKQAPVQSDHRSGRCPSAGHGEMERIGKPRSEGPSRVCRKTFLALLLI